MINSTLRCTHTQRSIIVKHILSLQESRQSEKGTYTSPGPSRARPPADKYGVKRPCRLCIHVWSAKPTVWGHTGAEMIKVAATHVKSQTLGIRYLNLMAKGSAFLRPTKTSTLGKPWQAFTPADWIHFDWIYTQGLDAQIQIVAYIWFFFFGTVCLYLLLKATYMWYLLKICLDLKQPACPNAIWLPT